MQLEKFSTSKGLIWKIRLLLFHLCQWSFTKTNPTKLSGIIVKRTKQNTYLYNLVPTKRKNLAIVEYKLSSSHSFTLQNPVDSLRENPLKITTST